MLTRSLIVFAYLTLGATLGISSSVARETGQYESKFREVDPAEVQRAAREAAEQQQPSKLAPAKPGTNEAAEQLQQLADNPYAQSQLLNYLGQQAIRNGDYEQGLQYIERLLTLNELPADALDPVRAQLPALYAATKQYPKLIQALEKKSKATEGLQPAEWLQLTDAYLQLQQPKQALRPINQAITTATTIHGAAPEDWYLAKLSILQQLQRKKAQRDTLNTMLRLFPSKTNYWLQLAQLQAEAKQWRSAVTTLDLAYRQSLLTEAEHLLLYARLTNRAGWPHRAGALLLTWIEQELVIDSANNWQEIASYWLAAHEYGRAIEALKVATEKSSAPLQQATLNLQLGQLNMDVGRWAEAIRAFDAALATGKVSASLGRTHLLRGTALYQTGDYDQALAAFTAASSQESVSAAASQWLNFIGQLAANNIAPATLTGALRSAAERGELAWAGEELTQRLARPAANQTSPQVSANNFNLSRPEAIVSLPTSNVNNEFIAPSLGTLLTPVGATQPGSTDGKIPPWQAGITPDKAPAGYTPGERPLNPFVDEQPLFTVTHDNVDEYKKLLSEGHLALLRKYPSYQLPVYPSHRTAAYPPVVYEATVNNAKTAELVGTESIKNAKLGFPFPRANTGAEVIWNHKMRYRGTTRVSINTSAQIKDGTVESRSGKQKIYFAYGNLTEPVSTDESNRLVYGLFQRGTGKRSDGIALVHEPADHQRQQRKIWVGGDGTRGRLITVPFIGYDFPIQDGGIFIDQLDMYNGAFDYYVWKLVGKRSMLVPYNAYPSIDPTWRHDQLLGKQHLNPEATRYEMHRVWVVDAQLRNGENHRLPRRRFYVDEDSWTILMVDNYNDQGELHKFQEAHPFVVYDQPFVAFAIMSVYDLINGDYSVIGMNNEHPFWEIDQGNVRPGEFTPNSAKRLLR